MLDHFVKQGKSKLREKKSILVFMPKQENYELLDSGNQRKLERYQNIIIDRPESQAIWQRQKGKAIWQQAHAIFTADKDETTAQGATAHVATEQAAISGKWHFPKGKLPPTWHMQLNKIDFLARFTSFRHVGVFPEQAHHWQIIENIIKSSKKKPLRVLNLFGYTGLASMVAARAGAEVTHVDSSKKACLWAKENQVQAKLQTKPIRWIIEDALKFCAREIRRKNKYDIIIADPPTYGRGTKGEKWHLLEHLPSLLYMIKKLQSENHKATFLTCYAIRLSCLALHRLMAEIYENENGELSSGELVIQSTGGEYISTSLFSQFIRGK